MKVRSSVFPPWLYLYGAGVRFLLIGLVDLLNTQFRLIIGVLVLGVFLAFIIHRYDDQWLKGIFIDDQFALALARFFSKWGDYQTYSVPLALVIALTGSFFARPSERRRWRRVALVCFLAATTAGLFSDLFRLTMGRPRPYVLMNHPKLEDKFYGPSFTWYGDYQSFPSGHAATSVGTAAALWVVSPPVGAAATIYAAGVIWSRLELKRHYPSDILVGTMIGLVFGGLVGWSAKIRSRAKILHTRLDTSANIT